MVHQAVKHDLSEAPDSMLLDELVDEYQAVHFNHMLHAEMAEMGGDCVTCHHYSPKGHIVFPVTASGATTPSALCATFQQPVRP